jgi:hypothetical protein
MSAGSGYVGRLGRRLLPFTAAALAALILVPQAAVAAPATAVESVASGQPLTVAQLIERLAAQQGQDPLALDPIDDAELDRMLTRDLAEYDEDADVRAAAQAALDTNDPVKIRDFLDNGVTVYRKAADTRKKIIAAENRLLVKEWSETGGPIVRQRSLAVLATNNDTKIADFVAIGKAGAEAADKQEEINAAERAKTIKARVEQIAAQGGYEVHAAGIQALESEDPEVIAEFYNTGYAAANARDAAAQQQIEAALAARSKAVADLADLAERATRAATAQKQVISASVAATQHLHVASNSMGLTNKYAKQADAIYAADIPIRKAGGQTHTADLTRLRTDTCAEAQVTARNADQVSAQSAVAATAAQTLVDVNLSHGVQWSEVMQAQADAGTAAKLAAQTACHAAEATEAAGKALDADRNATVEANNAVKYRQAAEREQAAAEKLAVQAQKLAETALAAEQDAREQKLIAQQKAADAWEHAEQAEAHYYRAKAQRDAARQWTAIAIAAQLRAREAAIRATTQQDVAKSKYEATKPLYDNAIKSRDEFAKKGQKAQGIMLRAQESYRNAKSAELEAQAAEARVLAIEVNCKNPNRPDGSGCPGPAEEAEIRRLAQQMRTNADGARTASDAAKVAADDAAAEVDVAGNAARQAAAAAAAAAAEARAAGAEARKAHRDATAAADAANSAIKDAQKANQAAATAVNVARQAINRAVAAKADAELTAKSAEESNRQAAIATFEAIIAGRAALNARATAQAIADPASAAIDAAAAYSEIDNDAALAASVAASALLYGEEHAAAAEKHADDAAAAAIHAAEQAERAQAQVKPAYEAAKKAAEAAGRAVKSAEVAVAAAKRATKEAEAAVDAANSAAEADRTAAHYARAADQMAAQAGHDAATAQQAWNSAKSFADTAKKAADNADRFADKSDEMARSATNMADAIHNIAKEIGQMPKNLEKAMWEAYHAEQQAKETEWQRWLKTQSDKALSKLPVGGDIAKGAMDAVIGNAHSIWMLGNCVLGPGGTAGDPHYVPDPSYLPNSDDTCNLIIQGVKDFLSSPWDILPDLDEWKKNWQKALGGTLVEVGSFFIPVAGQAGKLIKAGKLNNLGKLLRDDANAISLLFSRESVEKAIKKLGTINLSRLIDLKVDGNLKFDFTPDEVDDLIKAVDEYGFDELELTLRDLGDVPAGPVLKDLISFCPMPSGNSFTADTPVLLADGTRRPIAQIQVGDQVTATDPTTGVTSSEPVIALHRNEDTELADVTVAGAILSTTQHHLFWNATTQQWTETRDLRVGERLHTTTGAAADVTGVRGYTGAQTMYDLTVGTVHTYYVFAGDVPVLVHNKAAKNCKPLALGLRKYGLAELARLNGAKEFLHITDETWQDLVKKHLAEKSDVGVYVLTAGFRGGWRRDRLDYEDHTVQELYVAAAVRGARHSNGFATDWEMFWLAESCYKKIRSWDSVKFWDDAQGKPLDKADFKEPDWWNIIEPDTPDKAWALLQYRLKLDEKRAYAYYDEHGYPKQP